MEAIHGQHVEHEQWSLRTTTADQQEGLFYTYSFGYEYGCWHTCLHTSANILKKIVLSVLLTSGPHNHHQVINTVLSENKINMVTVLLSIMSLKSCKSVLHDRVLQMWRRESFHSGGVACETAWWLNTPLTEHRVRMGEHSFARKVLTFLSTSGLEYKSRWIERI